MANLMAAIKRAQSCCLFAIITVADIFPLKLTHTYIESTIRFINTVVCRFCWLLLLCFGERKWETFVVIEYLWTGNGERFLRGNLPSFSVVCAWFSYLGHIQFWNSKFQQNKYSYTRTPCTRKFHNQPQNNNGTRIFNANYAEINNDQECLTHSHSSV